MQRKSNSTLIRRFTGTGSRLRLLEAFRTQVIVVGNAKAARSLANRSTILHFQINQDLILQDGTDNDIYFILSGTVSIIVNGREVAKRDAGDHVGEMAMIDTTSRRSATVRAVEPVIAARIGEQDFLRIANKYPEIWRKIAIVATQRLRERNKFHPVPRSEPVIFIGSSSEGLEVAKTIHDYLLRFPCVPRLWSNGVFECSKTTIEDLMKLTKETDFSVIVLTPDDVTRSRGNNKPSPRDNVILELGLFMGSISRDRTYIVAQKATDIKIPTDLLGVTLLTYHHVPGLSITKNLKSVKKELHRLIEKLGPI